jgi:hypothetical protein
MKLHQHLSGGKEIKQAVTKIANETKHVFKGRDLFDGLKKEYLPKMENGEPLEGAEKQVVTTAKKRLEWTERKMCEGIDFEATLDATNLKAVADLEVDGVVLVKALPVTLLLALEDQLKEIRDIYDQVPTLDLSKKWEETGQDGILKYGPVDAYRTAKKTVPVVLHPGTDKHPPQVKDVIEDVMVGTWKTTYFTGSAHPGDKARWIERIDKLILAVAKARAKANEVEVDVKVVGKSLFDFIHERK